jgi:hypothetical protein
VAVRTLTGTWQSSTFDSVSIGLTQVALTFSQSGNVLSVTRSAATGPRGSWAPCASQGTVGRTPPRIFIVERGCLGVVEGREVTFAEAVWQLEPGLDGNVLTGLFGTLNTPAIYRVTLTRQ